VRVTVPVGHLNDGMRAETITRITRITRALAAVDDAPEGLCREPRA
jgi:hypothetical protein